MWDNRPIYHTTPLFSKGCRQLLWADTLSGHTIYTLHIQRMWNDNATQWSLWERKLRCAKKETTTIQSVEAKKNFSEENKASNIISVFFRRRSMAFEYRRVFGFELETTPISESSYDSKSQMASTKSGPTGQMFREKGLDVDLGSDIGSN